MPYHGHIGIIDKVAPGRKAKNRLVLVGRHVDDDHLDGRLFKVVVPRGNLVHIDGRCQHENTRYLQDVASVTVVIAVLKITLSAELIGGTHILA